MKNKPGGRHESFFDAEARPPGGTVRDPTRELDF